MWTPGLLCRQTLDETISMGIYLRGMTNRGTDCTMVHIQFVLIETKAESGNGGGGLPLKYRFGDGRADTWDGAAEPINFLGSNYGIKLPSRVMFTI